jgi:hypothetical protein
VLKRGARCAGPWTRCARNPTTASGSFESDSAAGEALRDDVLGTQRLSVHVNQASNVSWHIPATARSILDGRPVGPLSASHAPLQLLSGCIPAGAYRVRHRLIFDAGFWPVLKGPCGSRGRPMPRIPVATKHTMTPAETPAQQPAAAWRRQPCFWSSLLGQPCCSFVARLC